MNERLKELRKMLNLSQEEFGKIIGIKRAGVSEIEVGNRNVTEKHIVMLKHYGINEEWIRTGEGDVFAPKTKESEIADIVKVLYANKPTSFKFKVIKTMALMNEEQYDILEQFIRKLIDE